MTDQPTPTEPDWSVNPGEILTEKLAEMGLSQFQAADRMGVSQAHMSHLCTGRKGIGPATAIKLEALTGINANMWASLSAQYAVAQERKRRAA